MPHYYAVMDFECTCWDGNDRRRFNDHEIIEFPAVFMNSSTLEIEFEFRRFVRPTENPWLSDFCTDLTGITQFDVKYEDSLEQVLDEFDRFLYDNYIEDFTICTDGQWDIVKFLRPETLRKGIPFPDWACEWIDVRYQFGRTFRWNARWLSVGKMLAAIGMDFEGRQHSGLDDAHNIARILRRIHIKERRRIQATHGYS
jgi:3'-5' exoribonuclease 1